MRRFFLTFILFALGGASAIADDIFLQSESPVSHRHAVLEDDGTIAYLYLTEPGSIRPVRDAVAYTRLAPAAKADPEQRRGNSEPAPLTAAVASGAAVIATPDAAEFSFVWAADGESVALLRSGQPLALSTAGEKLGYSKAVRTASALAHPWSEERFRELFGR